MGIIKSTSKKPDGPCSFEGCKETIKQGGDYLWDFSKSKAYCTNHEEMNKQVQESSGSQNKGGQFKPGYKAPATFRTPEDGATALEIFASFCEKRLPGVIEKLDGTPNENQVRIERIDHWTKVFLAVFLGKTEVNQGGKTS
jgi:hypothetical protein